MWCKIIDFQIDFQDDITSALSEKRTNDHQFEQVGEVWMGADFIEEENKWVWAHHHKEFSSWTNWLSQVENIGKNSSVTRPGFFSLFFNFASKWISPIFKFRKKSLSLG